METWDDERGDRAIVSLVPHLSRAALFEELWPYAMRSYTDIGHKVIFATQVERVLARLGPEEVEPALRSLVNGLLFQEEDGPRTESFEAARARVQRFPADWQKGEEKPEKSGVLLTRMRTDDIEQVQDQILAALDEGLGPATVWDGLRLVASELYHRRPAHAARRAGPVHPVTEVNAFHYVFQTSRREPTRRLALLQAAGWLAHLRTDLIGFYGDLEGETLDRLVVPVDETISQREILHSADPQIVAGYLGAHSKARDAVLSNLRLCLFDKAGWNHQYKFAAAVQEECRLVHPRWMPHILAPAVTYLPGAGDPTSEVARRSREALVRAGVV